MGGCRDDCPTGLQESNQYLLFNLLLTNFVDFNCVKLVFLSPPTIPVYELDTLLSSALP